MKTLFLLRHAKSSWADATMLDRDRPLNKRGMRDSPRMGFWLAQQQSQPDLIVSSPAVRALTTATIMAKAPDSQPIPLVTNERIYEASPEDLIQTIQGFDELEGNPNNVMLVGHNPGLTELINRINGVVIDNVPTCGLATIEFDCDQWNAIAMAFGTLISFQYPKQLDMQGFHT